MDPAKKPLQSKAITAVLIMGLVAFLIYIVFFIDPQQVIDVLSKTNLAIYSGAFVAYILYTFCSSMVWNSLLNSLSVKVSKRKAFLFTWVGLFFDAAIPQLGWSGELSRTYLLAKDSQVDAGRIGASVVGQKILTMTIAVGALSAGLGLVLFRYSLPLAASLLIGIVLFLSILTLAVVYYVSFKPLATKTLLRWAIKVALVFRKRWNPEGFSAEAERLLGNFHSSIEQLKANPKALIEPIFFVVAGFALEVAVVFLVFISLGQPVPIDVVLVVFTLSGILQTIGVAIFGFPELIMTITYKSLGVDLAVAFSVALLTRVVSLWFRLVVSYAALQWAGIKIIRQNQQYVTKQ